MANISFDSRTNYLVGAQYIQGHWEFTDDNGCIHEGDSDKWELHFLSPLNPFKSNSKCVHGLGSSTVTVKGSHIPYLFGYEPEDFSKDVVKSLIGSPVVITRDNKNAVIGISPIK